MKRSLQQLAALTFAGALVTAGCSGAAGPAGAKGDPGALGDPGPKGDPGATGETGSTGETGAKGDPGEAAPTTGIIAGAITDSLTHATLEGVKVTARDAAGDSITDATTDAAGAFQLTLPAGVIQLTFEKQYFSGADLSIGVVVGRTVTIAATMAEAASGAPSIALAAPGDGVGYGAAVPLTATANDPNGDTLTFVWQNATIPALGSLTGNGASATLTMPTMTEAFAKRVDPANPGGFISGYRLDSRFGVIPILPDTRGQISVTVTASDGRGQSASASLTINAASIAGGIRNFALGTRVYFNSGHDDPNAWTLTTAPAGSTAALENATTRTPSLVLDRQGQYTLTEGTNSINVFAGRWVGALGGGVGNEVTPDMFCTGCHNDSIAPDKFTSWKQTQHATMFTRGINGVASSHYSAACLECHTVGFDKSANNGGFDDVAQQMGWTFPSQLAATNWTKMSTSTASLAKLGNIQCENCHGPNDSGAHMGTRTGGTEHPFASPRIAYNAEVCGTCHAAGSHHIYSEWATPSPANADGVEIGHSNPGSRTRALSGTTINRHCGRCHSTQGFLLYTDELEAGRVTLNQVPSTVINTITPENIESPSCIACHDPHDATNPNQLRVYGDTSPLPGGFQAFGLGKGALCITCHNSRNGSQTGSDTLTYLHEDGEAYNSGNPTGYSAPHQAAQGDVFVGRNAYFMGGRLPMVSDHAAIEDTCVGCHMALQPKTHLNFGNPAPSQHLFRIADEDREQLCSNCHGNNTVSGEGIQASVEAGLAALESKMAAAAKAKINAAGVIKVRAYDVSTDYYSSSSASNSNVQIDVTANPVSSIEIEEGHGQIELVLTFTQPVADIPFVTGTGATAPSKTMQTFGVQLGNVKDGSNVVLYALSGDFVRAGWNYFLVHGDSSKGLHNPSFVRELLSATLSKDLSN
jgi:predicted CXXCH cytochrome family protein